LGKIRFSTITLMGSSVKKIHTNIPSQAGARTEKRKRQAKAGKETASRGRAETWGKGTGGR
jgi:hypothetical protein